MDVDHITPEILNNWLKSDQAILFDVREPAEYIAEHIQQALNLPLAEVSSDLIDLPELKNKKLVFQCKTGRRSMSACEKLQDANGKFSIYNLEGGIVAWKEYGLPTVAK